MKRKNKYEDVMKEEERSNLEVKGKREENEGIEEKRKK